MVQTACLRQANHHVDALEAGVKDPRSGGDLGQTDVLGVRPVEVSVQGRQKHRRQSVLLVMSNVSLRRNSWPITTGLPATMRSGREGSAGSGID